MKTKIGAVFLIITIMVIGCVLPSISSDEISKNEKDNPSSLNFPKIAYLKRCYAEGTALSGRTFNATPRIGIIKFESVRFSKLKLIPPRWEFSDYEDATAIVFMIDQEIPEGPFEFERDWVRALVFY
jgi:hypothetical protein